MRHMLFDKESTYKVAILIKDTAFDLSNLNTYYMHYLYKSGLLAKDFYAVTLAYRNNKVTAKQAQSYLADILPTIGSIGTQYIYCADATYFKALTNSKKTDEAIGYVLPCTIQGYEHLKVIYGLNYGSLMYNPGLQEKMTLTLQTVVSQLTTGSVTELGKDIIQSANYPVLFNDIKSALDNLHQYPEITVDIEAFSLQFNKAGIGTISFAWSENEGTAFLVDYRIADPSTGMFGVQQNNSNVKELLRNFFDNYQGNLIAHNANYDFKVMVYELWMEHPLDRVGMLKGINTITRLFDDTAIMAYLALNTTAKFDRSLKSLAHSFTGKYSQEDIKDIRKIPPQDLLRYNLIDCLATFHIKNKFMPILINDNQLDLYNGLMKDSIKLILQMELTGMPLDDSKIQLAKQQMIAHACEQYKILSTNYWVHEAVKIIRKNACSEANSKLKKLVKPLEQFNKVTFNPNSSDDLKVLLHEVMHLPVLAVTPTKEPATGAKILKALINHTDSVTKIAAIKALLELAKVSKVLSTFIPAFENGFLKADGSRYLHGSFKLGGTVTGRMSSNNPNMQNIPSGSTYGKLIKSCFVAPKGWLMVYADYSSLEDRISALLTKDQNKLRVYTDGYDGHCLRAYYYFQDQLPHIDPNSVESINSIEVLHPQLRQDSKAPTFLLTYQGTWVGMMKNCGFSEPKAKSIEANYHAMYHVSDAYVQAATNQAAKDGYLTVAFGLRIRTAIIHKVVEGTRVTPYASHKERKTLGNAMGQSYGLLNNRSTVAFMKLVQNSKHVQDVFCISMIHDASYFLIRDDVEVIKFVNDNLIPEMYWQEDPAIAHDEVKLGGNLEVCFKGWHDSKKVHNNATLEEIQVIYNEGVNKT